jgi:hypothetical protein
MSNGLVTRLAIPLTFVDRGGAYLAEVANDFSVREKCFFISDLDVILTPHGVFVRITNRRALECHYSADTRMPERFRQSM